jgi:hypothetical protein
MDQFNPHGATTDGTSPSLTEQAGALAHDLKDQAAEAGRQIKGHAADLAEGAKGLASDAGDRLRDTLADQKAAGADYVGGIAKAVRRAAGEFDEELPQAAQYIRRAAEQMDGVSNALRRRDFNELLGGVQDFARRQPTAFLGATVLAGFVLVRFLKSSNAATATETGGEAGNGANMTRSSNDTPSSPVWRNPASAPADMEQRTHGNAYNPSMGR